MFDFAKTVVCGVAKGVVGFLAAVGGAHLAVMLVSDAYADSVGAGLRDALNEELEGD